MRIRLEEEKDYLAVECLTREAFWNVYRPGCVEHLIVHNLRPDPCFVPELDYVLEDGQKLIAHIAYAKGLLTLDNGCKQELLLLGPVSVLPAQQGKGYGAKLIGFTLERAKQLGYPAVVLTGSPDYYSRFGFVPAAAYGIYNTGMERKKDAPFFMINVLDADAMQALKGTYTDPACYFVQDADAEAFDKQFPLKKKAVKPGQLTSQSLRIL